MLEASEGRAPDDRVTVTLVSGRRVEARCRAYGGELLAVPEVLVARRSGR